jgi:uncharacterized protein YciI
MFIIDLNYIEPLEELDQHMADHVKFLSKYYKKGTFVASGRKVPRTGGIILALADTEENVHRIITEDPFTKKSTFRIHINTHLPSSLTHLP